MPVELSATFRSARCRSFQVVRALTSPVVVIALLAFVLGFAALSVAFAASLLPVTPTLLGFWYLLAGIAAALALGFTYATTYYPFQPAPLTPAQALARVEKDATTVVNVAETLDLDLLAVAIRHRASFEKLVLALLATASVRALLLRLEIEPEEAVRLIKARVLPGFSAEELWERTLQVAADHRSPTVALEHAAAALLLHPALATWLRHYHLVEQDIAFVLDWISSLRQWNKERRRWWQAGRLLAIEGVGLSWAAGFTPLMDTLARFPAGNWWDGSVIGRTDCLRELVTTLARREGGNVLLVGQPGTGRLGVVKEMARLVRTNQAHPALANRRVAYLHIGEVLGLANSPAAQLSILSRLLREMERAGNIIAVVDGFGSLLGTATEERVNLTDVLMPFLSSPAIRVVVIMSGDEYHLRIKANEELVHLFEVLQVPEADEDITLRVLALAAPSIERGRGIYLPYRTLRALVMGTSGILQQVALPERAFDVLEEALTAAEARKARVLHEEDINDLLARKVGVPIGQLRDRERAHLLNLEEFMHQRLINQNRAVAAVARAMIRARASVRDTRRPIGSFLFLGPTGVGKTETAKTLAEAYFGSEDYLTRFDMAEFRSEEGLSLLIGSLTHPVGRLTSAIEDQPFTVLLLDEFEKAHRNVQQLFLSILDEGWLTDARGRRTSFQHCIIIATSNAGAEFIRQAVTKGPLPSDFDQKLRDHVLREDIFRPELLNRFDGIVTFTPLLPVHIEAIARLMLRQLNQRLDASHGVTVAITDELLAYLVQYGYSAEFGARPMRRLIESTVEYTVARMVLQGLAEPGRTITLSSAQLASL